MTEIKNSILAGLAFGFLLGLFITFLFNLQYALIAGPVSGLLFGITVYLFMTSKIVKRQTQIENLDVKEIIHSGGANHFIKREAVGGKLYLMNDKLHFKSHGFNIHNHEFVIQLCQIKTIRYCNTLGLVPNGLEIESNDGRIDKFVVSDRKQWRNKIENNKNRA